MSNLHLFLFMKRPYKSPHPHSTPPPHPGPSTNLSARNSAVSIRSLGWLFLTNSLNLSNWWLNPWSNINIKGIVHLLEKQAEHFYCVVFTPSLKVSTIRNNNNNCLSERINFSLPSYHSLKTYFNKCKIIWGVKWDTSACRRVYITFNIEIWGGGRYGVGKWEVCGKYFILVDNLK